MSDKFQNKYRIESARLKHWDYSWTGEYFITICTKDREYFFGNVTNGKMQLSHAGVIANILWYEIKNHEKNIELGEFIVMPNHIHGILILNENNENYNSDGSPVETLHATSLQKTMQRLYKNNRTPPKTNNYQTFPQNPDRFRPLSVPTNLQ